MVCDLVLYALLLAWFDFFEIWKIGVVESVFLGGGSKRGFCLHGFLFEPASSNLFKSVVRAALFPF